jgi:heme A synthase
MVKRLLQVIAVTVLVGGGIRLFANRALFEIAGIGDVWIDQPYAVYIYRVLGAFVVFVGVVVIMVARDPERYHRLLVCLAGAFLFVGVVMIVAGSILALPLRFYLPDPLYCFAVAGLILIAAIAP